MRRSVCLFGLGPEVRQGMKVDGTTPPWTRFTICRSWPSASVQTRRRGDGQQRRRAPHRQVSHAVLVAHRGTVVGSVPHAVHARQSAAPTPSDRLCAGASTASSAAFRQTARHLDVRVAGGALPALRGTGGNTLAKTLHSSSHRGAVHAVALHCGVPPASSPWVLAGHPPGASLCRNHLARATPEFYPELCQVLV